MGKIRNRIINFPSEYKIKDPKVLKMTIKDSKVLKMTIKDSLIVAVVWAVYGGLTSAFAFLLFLTVAWIFVLIVTWSWNPYLFTLDAVLFYGRITLAFFVVGAIIGAIWWVLEQ